MTLPLALSAAALLAACLVGFGLLGRLSPCNPGEARFLSRPMATDLAYGALGLLYAGLVPAGVALLVAAVSGSDAPQALAQVRAGYGWLGRLPLWLQVLVLLMATDLVQYWLHRVFHGRALWGFHEIHHGAEQVNWTTAFRIHPVNYLIYNTSLAIAARLAGFSPQAFLLAAPIAFFSAAIAHANLDWTFGPLRFVVASPVFHRWHHTSSPETRERNFAPMFPVWDLMFGTFHMPAGQRPSGYGVPGSPRDIPSQLWRPFRPWAAVLTRARPGGRAA
jgi:sterol desaturase/sphingolipid hydroxylase (fatty acid hydroxylase superfamily)